jgi:hypothetical protein
MPTNAFIIDLADTLVAALNNWAVNEADGAFVANRKVVPVFEDTKLAALQVCVVPGGATWELLTRGPQATNDLIVDVGFQKKITSIAAADTEVPPLLALMESTVTFLRGNRSHNGATLLRVENDPIYSPDSLQTKHLFLSVLRLTFKRGA